MKTEHKFIGGALAALAAAVCVVLGITTINSRIVNALFHKTTAEYSITLSSSNKVTSSGDVDQKTALGNNVKFTYSGVQSSTTGHATLNNDGKLVNKDWIRSITAFTCSFTTAGSLTAKTSFGGDVWNSGFVLESGVRYETGSNPYYLEISSSGVSTISTLKIEYSCSINSEAHEGEEVGDGLLGVVDFWDSSNSGDTGTSTIVNAAYVQARCYDTDDVSTHEAKALVSAVTASYVYQKRYGGIGLSSGNNAASLTLTLSTGIEPTSVVVIAGSQSPSKTLSLNDSGQSVSKNCTGITALNDTYTNSLTWNFESAPSSLAFTCAKSSKLAIYRIYLYGSSGPSFNTPDECIGFTVDAKNTEFKSSDVFDNTHGLTVTAHYSNSDAVTLGKGGEDGYSYVVRLGEDISSNVVDTSKAFNTQKDLTTLYVTVSYKDFIDYQYQINVAFARHLDSIEVNCETTIFNTTHKFEDYTNEVFVNLDYNKDSYNKTNVPYQDFSIYSISLSLLNPNGVSSSVSSPFGTAGTWTIKVTSDEDNSVYGELDITVNPVLVTTITVTGQNDVTTLQVDSTLQLNVSCGPEGATNKTVTWSSSNNSVATVNTNGLVTGKSEGTVRINATANDGSNVVGYIDLTITPKPAQSEIDADLAAGNNSMSCTVSGSSGIKVGTSKATGSMTITVGAGATKLSFYAAGWNGSNTSITLSGATIGTSNFSLTADSGISGSGSSYTLSITLSIWRRSDL